MAIYGNPADLRPKKLRAFDETWPGGAPAILPGIYRSAAGVETILRDGEVLPDGDDWRLVVAVEEQTVVKLPEGARTGAAPRMARAV